MFDITQEAVAETAELDLKRADGSPMLDGDGKQLSITLCGPGSPTHVQARAEVKRRARARADKATGSLFAALDNTGEDEAHFLATVTVSFNGWEYPAKDGKWKSQQEMFKAAYLDQSLGFIRDQADRFVGDWGNFSKA